MVVDDDEIEDEDGSKWMLRLSTVAMRCVGMVRRSRLHLILHTVRQAEHGATSFCKLQSIYKLQSAGRSSFVDSSGLCSTGAHVYTQSK